MSFRFHFPKNNSDQVKKQTDEKNSNFWQVVDCFQKNAQFNDSSFRLFEYPKKAAETPRLEKDNLKFKK